jgi:hypothetical protein
MLPDEGVVQMNEMVNILVAIALLALFLALFFGLAAHGLL